MLLTLCNPSRLPSPLLYLRAMNSNIDTHSEIRERIIVALDLPTREAALDAATQIRDQVGWVKVATTLFSATGPRIVEELRALGLRVFLDLKFHDIPAQVLGAVRSATGSGAQLLTVHASGGRAMLAAAAEGAADSDCKVVAVTVLTSLDTNDLADIGVADTPQVQVPRLARLAFESGVHGIVCSPKELDALRPELPSPFIMVTPGIRPAGAQTDDQKRIMTPSDAIRAGADYLVIGRPILKAPNPNEAAQQIVDSVVKDLSEA